MKTSSWFVVAGVTTAIAGGFLHNPSPSMAKLEESQFWALVSITGAAVALFGVGMRVVLGTGRRAILAVGRHVLVAWFIAAWISAWMFHPSPILIWDNLVPLAVFVSATIFTTLYALITNYLI